jgi:hypothetical protein
MLGWKLHRVGWNLGAVEKNKKAGRGQHLNIFGFAGSKKERHPQAQPIGFFR